MTASLCIFARRSIGSVSTLRCVKATPPRQNVKVRHLWLMFVLFNGHKKRLGFGLRWSLVCPETPVSVATSLDGRRNSFAEIEIGENRVN